MCKITKHFGLNENKHTVYQNVYRMWPGESSGDDKLAGIPCRPDVYPKNPSWKNHATEDDTLEICSLTPTHTM